MKLGSSKMKPNVYREKRFEAQMCQKLTNFIVKELTTNIGRSVFVIDFARDQLTSVDVCRDFVKWVIGSYYSEKQVREDVELYSPKELKTIEILDKNMTLSDYSQYTRYGYYGKNLYNLKICVNGWFIVNLQDKTPWRLLTLIRVISDKYGLGNYDPTHQDLEHAIASNDYDWIVKMCQIANKEYVDYIMKRLYDDGDKEHVELKSRCMRALNTRSDCKTELELL